ncbi:MAG TPA: epoxyqueuosine reductase QueH [Bacilli bacterium]|nr:epoxyqueuosine reductase QueH [Bacilli bacterium]
MEKINYYNVSLAEIAKFKELGRRPTLALHACCAPCSSHTLEFLTTYFDITIVYENSNVYPEAEFTKRRDEIEYFIEEFNKRNETNVKIVFLPYDHEGYMADLRKFADEPEGGERCRLCYAKHIEDALIYATENGFDYASTTLTISRQKNSQVINQVAKEVSKNFSKVKYFYSDFKKKGGLMRVQEMKEEYGLYQQLYCGCEYSYSAMLKHRKKPRK